MNLLEAAERLDDKDIVEMPLQNSNEQFTLFKPKNDYYEKQHLYNKLFKKKENSNYGKTTLNKNNYKLSNNDDRCCNCIYLKNGLKCAVFNQLVSPVHTCDSYKKK